MNYYISHVFKATIGVMALCVLIFRILDKKWERKKIHNQMRASTHKI
jgi:hypothetical protein